MMMEALADAGVLQGLPREVSYNLVAHSLIGAAKMVLETGKHPAGLKVCFVTVILPKLIETIL